MPARVGFEIEFSDIYSDNQNYLLWYSLVKPRTLNHVVSESPVRRAEMATRRIRLGKAIAPTQLRGLEGHSRLMPPSKSGRKFESARKYL
jgi:hypothetical protein